MKRKLKDPSLFSAFLISALAADGTKWKIHSAPFIRKSSDQCSTTNCASSLFGSLLSQLKAFSSVYLRACVSSKFKFRPLLKRNLTGEKFYGFIRSLQSLFTLLSQEE
jgi:hypothetical protein